LPAQDPLKHPPKSIPRRMNLYTFHGKLELTKVLVSLDAGIPEPAKLITT